MSDPALNATVPLVCRVRRVRRETPDVRTLEVEPGNGSPMEFQAGQFNMLSSFGAGEVPISISGDPSRPGPWVHTVRAVGPATRLLCGLRRGDPIFVRGPFGKGWPVEQAVGADVLFLAGGVGLAPLRPALYHVLSQRRRYGRVALLYGARSPRDLLYAAELTRWRGRFDLEVEVTVDHAGDAWAGEVGVVTQLLPFAPLDPDETVVMACGPEIMMRFTADSLLNRGFERQHIYVSLERNMECGMGLCGHCQLGPLLICRDGPVFRFDRIESLLRVPEL